MSEDEIKPKRCHWCRTITDKGMFCSIKCWNDNFAYHAIIGKQFIEEEMSNECKPIESNELLGEK